MRDLVRSLVFRSIVYTSKRSISNLYTKHLYASNNPLSLSKLRSRPCSRLCSRPRWVIKLINCRC